MELTGRVEHGVVVLPSGVSLPEGAMVTVFYRATQTKSGKRVDFPLVSSGEPGTIHLTNERIQEILDEEDIAGLKRSWNAPS
jgi:hypothetical protein